ncbi:MAG: glycosyltransferase family 39 protein [Bryobacteraceae bacterium]
MLRQSLLIAALVLLIRLPFLNQAIQGDDAKYLAMAQHAQIDPLHPTHLAYAFQGQMVQMQGYPHPPLNAWALAALLAIFGDIYEVPFHAAYIGFSLIAALSMLALARRFSSAPVWATLLFVATPAFVINGTSLESDLPFLAFWMLGFALFVSAVDRRSGVLLAASAAGLALASMAAYQAVAAAPILAYYLWQRDRIWRPGWLGVLVAPAVVAAYQLYEKQSSGTVPATVLAGYFQTYGLQQIANKLKNAAALTVHTGWIVFPLLAAVAFRKRWMYGVAAGAAGIFIDTNPLFWVSFGIGVMVLASCIERRPEFLKAWVLVFFASSLVIFFAGSARYLLPMAAPVVLLAVRDLRWARPAFALQLALSLALAVVNYQHWDGYRQFVSRFQDQILSKRTWINGEWVQFYAESDGALPVMLGQALRPGELLISSDLGYPVAVTTGGGQLAPLAERDITPLIPLRLIGLGSKSGYSTADAGFRPFDISTQPIDRVRLQVVVERKPTQSYLTMNAPEAENQIVSGLFATETSWRWMGDRAVILLKPPPQPQPLHVVFNIPDLAPARRVTVSLDGAVLEDKTYDKPGGYTLTTKPVSGRTLTISVDKTFSTGGDRRQLGIIISELGFR